MEQGLFLGKKKFRVAELSCLGKIFIMIVVPCESQLLEFLSI